MKMYRGCKTIAILTTAAVCLFLRAAPAEAALLGLLQNTDFINSQFLEVTYDHNSDQLAVGPGIFGIQMNLIVDPITPGTFALNATVDASGAISNASLLVSADLGLGDGLQTYFYSEQIARFGFGDTLGSDIMEFVFVQQTDPVNGTNSQFAQLGNEVGVILQGFDPSFSGNFSSSFSNAAGPFAGSNTFFNPEPSSLSLIAAGACLLFRRPGRSRVFTKVHKSATPQ